MTTKSITLLFILFAITPGRIESAYDTVLPSYRLTGRRHAYALTKSLRLSRPSISQPPSLTYHTFSPCSTGALKAHETNHNNRNSNNDRPEILTSRRSSIQSTAIQLSILLAGTTTTVVQNDAANAAPPYAVIAEELGYFPVTNREGAMVYVPARVKRESSEQSILLAKYLTQIGVTMFGTYWCPHCQNQKEIFGKEAWASVSYVECSTKGFGYDSTSLPPSVLKEIDGFPTWKIPAQSKKTGGKTNSKTSKVMGGEMSLEILANLSGYKGDFNGKLESPVPLRPGSCS